MANPAIPTTYGVDFRSFQNYVSGISLQLHITAECDNNCKHCYMRDSPFYANEIKNPLKKSEFIQLINEYFAFLSEFSATGSIVLTGGDPLLSPNFWDILNHIHENYSSQCSVFVLGNSSRVDSSSASLMQQMGVSGYQISIDGLATTHDYLRSTGSFADAFRALKIIHDVGMRAICAFTVTKFNANEYLHLYNYVRNLRYIDAFGFDRMIPIGKGITMIDQLFTSTEYRQFLFDVFKYEAFNYSGIISRKEQMWRPFLYELGLVDPISEDEATPFREGCCCGTGNTSILADGTMLPCRKMNISAGKYPERSFRELFINNDVVRLLRQYNKYDSCTQCEVNSICRGCPSMKYAVSGDIFSCDPYCWRANND